MASIKDAIEETTQDSNSWLKYILYSLPLYFSVNMLMKGSFAGYIILYAISGILLFGFMLKCTYNVRMGNNAVLPTFNLLETFWLGLKGSIAILPISIVSYFIASLVCGYLATFLDGIVFKILVYAISAIALSFVYTSYLLYAKKFSIVDAYNIKKIFTHCIDVIAAVIWMAILLSVFNIVIFGSLTYIAWLFIGLKSPIMVYLWCIAGVVNVAIMGHYLAQIDYEVIPLTDEETEDIGHNKENMLYSDRKK